MNTRIERDFYFHAALHFKKEFYVNTYDITLSMLIDTDSAREQQVAMDRILHYLKCIFSDCIFVHCLDTESINKYKMAGIRVCELPEEPWDQVVAMVVLNKLNAIMENRIRITDMVLASAMSEGVRYSIVSEEAESVLAGNNWWNNASMSITNENGYPGENVVKLFHEDDWISLGLSWKEMGKT
jgi:hypothetical protein